MNHDLMNWLKAICLSVIAVFTPIHGVIVTVGIFIFADLFLGIWAAIKRGEAITSAAMGRTVTRMCVYQVAILTGFLGDKYLLPSFIPATKLIASTIGIVQLTSILENAGSITGMSFGKLIKLLGSKNDT